MGNLIEMSIGQLQDLFEKYRNGTLTEEERALLESWYADGSDEKELHLSEDEIETELAKLRASIPHIRKKSFTIKPGMYIAAASVALLIFVGIKTLYHRPSSASANKIQQVATDVQPGNRQATLTLADGRKIILKKGMAFTAQQGNATISINDSAGVSYLPTVANAAAQYNVMTTAAGEQSPYPLVLSDGTKIWLNAESSIRFPAAFSGNERMVEVTGEAYFEVAHLSGKPFSVKVKDMIVRDLGTHFNINAYDDEPGIKTTLLEGSVDVSKNNKSVILKPGQQAFARQGQSSLRIRLVNTSEVVAWKNGRFEFDRTDLKSIMRQLARWYDLTIIYNGNIENDVFDGTIRKDLLLSDMLKILQSNNIHFQIKITAGKKELIILP